MGGSTKGICRILVLNLEYGDDLSYLLENMGDDAVKAYGNAPIWDNTKKDDYGAQQLYSKKLDLHLKREAAYDRNKKKVYTILYGQCTPSLLSGIKSSNEFNTKDKDKDPVWIMKLIKRLSVGIDESDNELCTIFQLNKRFYSMYQTPIESNDDYFERFDEEWKTTVTASGKESLVPKVNFASKKYVSKTQDEIEEVTKAMYLLLMSDRIRYGEKVREISENIVLGNDSFP